MTRTEWWMRLSPFVAGFNDGHTSVFYPSEEILRKLEGGALLFPVDVTVDEDRRLLVSAVYGDGAGLQLGGRIVELNGRPLEELLADWKKEFSGESDIYLAATVADHFRDLLVLHSPDISWFRHPPAIAKPVAMPSSSARGTARL